MLASLRLLSTHIPACITRPPVFLFFPSVVCHCWQALRGLFVVRVQLLRCRQSATSQPPSQKRPIRPIAANAVTDVYARPLVRLGAPLVVAPRGSGVDEGLGFGAARKQGTALLAAEWMCSSYTCGGGAGKIKGRREKRRKCQQQQPGRKCDGVPSFPDWSAASMVSGSMGR